MKLTCEFPDNILPINTKVFITRPAINDVLEDEIIGYYCVLVNVDNVPSLFPTDYRLNTINLCRDSHSDGWKGNEFFLSYEEAKTMAVEYKVNVSAEEWLTAIGLSGIPDEERTQFDDECELKSCCANISAIRDILYDLCLTSKINGVTRNALISLLKQHEPPTSYPSLTKILAQLNIDWSKLEEDTH